MSDFDKEAEREKLRQQYEKDKEERQATQRMSELLLQGATMTGKHCDTCGDPIFRYDGTEFCPTCQQETNTGTTAESASGDIPTEETAAGAASADGPSADATSADAASANTTPADGATEIEVEQSGSNPETNTQSDESGQPPTPPRQPRRAPSSQSEAARGRSREPHQAGAQADARRDEFGDTGDLTGARNALRRKLTRLAREAEETDDVGYARELLSATREAAEALAALERAKR
ncbi:Sjogren's syndrome/scleroderma autoantigen 1 family protein [Haladaptatus sp. NG-SE-30]